MKIIRPAPAASSRDWLRRLQGAFSWIGERAVGLQVRLRSGAGHEYFWESLRFEVFCVQREIKRALRALGVRKRRTGPRDFLRLALTGRRPETAFSRDLFMDVPTALLENEQSSLLDSWLLFYRQRLIAAGERAHLLDLLLALRESSPEAAQIARGDVFAHLRKSALLALHGLLPEAVGRELARYAAPVLEAAFRLARVKIVPGPFASELEAFATIRRPTLRETADLYDAACALFT